MSDEINCIRANMSDILELFGDQEDINNSGGPNDAMQACSSARAVLSVLDTLNARIAALEGALREIASGSHGDKYLHGQGGRSPELAYADARAAAKAAMGERG